MARAPATWREKAAKRAQRHKRGSESALTRSRAALRCAGIMRFLWRAAAHSIAHVTYARSARNSIKYQSSSLAASSCITLRSMTARIMANARHHRAVFARAGALRRQAAVASGGKAASREINDGMASLSVAAARQINVTRRRKIDSDGSVSPTMAVNQ